MIEIITAELSFTFVVIGKTNDMGILKQLGEYLYLRKKDPEAPDTQWIKYMHGINRLSVFLFLFALIVMLIKFVIIPLLK